MDPRVGSEPSGAHGEEPGTPVGSWWLLVFCTLAIGGWIVSQAWVGEDAQISFRTIDNFVAGHGLRWNVDERVQSFTHPLWLLLLSALYATTREWFFTVTALGLLCSLAAFWMLAWPHRRRPVVLLLAILAPFVLSRSLVLFSTSGFENPLSHLLFAAFALTLAQRGQEPPWLRLFLIAALAATNRLDTMLLYLPALVSCVLVNRRSLRWGRIALGSAPLLTWCAFSLFYFGFITPNTAPAKLSAALSTSWYLERGLAWGLALFRHDLASGLILSLGLLLALFGVVRPRVEASWERSLGLGLLLYSGYVVSVGGDYIVGRFWTLPLLGSILLLSGRALPLYRRLLSFPVPTRVACLATLLAFALMARPAAGRVLDGLSVEPPERLQARARVSLGRDLRWEYSKVARRLHEIGLALGDEASRAADGRPLAVSRKTIGFVGAAAGRRVILVDLNALADPLLARLAPLAAAREDMKAGHLWRPLPEGYLHFRSTGELERMDPLLRRYFEPLREIVSGPLFSRHRLATLVRFHLGSYDEWLERYERRSGG